MECISFRRPKNQLKELRKYRSVIFQRISAEKPNKTPNVVLPSRSGSGWKSQKNAGSIAGKPALLTTSVLLPSGAVVQLPISLAPCSGHTKSSKKAIGHHNKIVWSTTGKRKATHEADICLSIGNVRKRGRLTGKAVWRHVRFLQCFKSVSCDSSPVDHTQQKKHQLPTIHEMQTLEAY